MRRPERDQIPELLRNGEHRESLPAGLRHEMTIELFGCESRDPEMAIVDDHELHAGTREFFR